MSVAAITAAWGVNCDPTQKLVLLALADHTNDESGECWPSLTHICRKTGLGRSTVARALKALESDRIIGRKQRGRQTTVYILNVANWSHSGTSANAGLVPERDQGSATAGPQVVPERDGGSARAGHGTVREPSGEPSGKRKGSAIVPCPDGVSADVWSDFLAHRRGMKAALKPNSWKPMEKALRTLEGEGWSPDDVLTEVMSAGWRSFKAEWIRKRCGPSQKDNDDDGYWE